MNLHYNDDPDAVWHYCLDYVDEPLAVLYDGNVINVDDFVHVICGKVICWNKEELSLEDKFISDLIEFAKDSLYEIPSQPRVAGHGNVFFIFAYKSPTWPEARFAGTDHHIDELPDVLKHNVKLCCPYYEEHGL